MRERARGRTRIHKLLDAAGLRVGGILSDLFGVNGLRILEGLAAEQPKETILASLSRHVRRHVEPLHDALSGELNAHSRLMLHDHLQAFHAANERLHRYDRLLHDGLAEYRDSLDLLMTIPGIDRTSACALLVELGPDIEVFASRRHCARLGAGLCPGNRSGPQNSDRVVRVESALMRGAYDDGETAQFFT